MGVASFLIWDYWNCFFIYYFFFALLLLIVILRKEFSKSRGKYGYVFCSLNITCPWLFRYVDEFGLFPFKKKGITNLRHWYKKTIHFIIISIWNSYRSYLWNNSTSRIRYLCVTMTQIVTKKFEQKEEITSKVKGILVHKPDRQVAARRAITPAYNCRIYAVMINVGNHPFLCSNLYYEIPKNLNKYVKLIILN
jgi:hypothetical protein